MRLIEKECPNCGAGLHFDKDDTTCKCEYCKREFEIERDTEKKKLNEQYILSELKTPFKIFSYFTFGSIISQAAFGFFAFLIIIIISFGIVMGLRDSNSMFNRNAPLVTSINELSNSDYSAIDLNAKIIISNATTSTTGNYINKGKINREKVYIISNKKRNYIIPIYKVIYTNFTNSSDSYTLYIPVSYKNVRRKNNSITFYLNNSEIASEKFYFNDDDYSYGYSDLDTLYKEVIKPFEDDYKIEEK